MSLGTGQGEERDAGTASVWTISLGTGQGDDRDAGTASVWTVSLGTGQGEDRDDRISQARGRRGLLTIEGVSKKIP